MIEITKNYLDRGTLKFMYSWVLVLADTFMYSFETGVCSFSVFSAPRETDNFSYGLNLKLYKQY